MSEPEVWPAAEVEAASRELLGRPLAPHEHGAFRRYAELLLRWNRTHRLVGPRTLPAMARELVIDALCFSPLLPAGPLRAIDVGAGAGIPGIPLLLVTERMRLVLLESRRKRVSFLLAATRELSLDRAEVIHARAEDVLTSRGDLGGVFDVVLARCVARPLAMAALARPFLRPGGLMIVAGSPRPFRVDVTGAGPPGPALESRIVRVPSLGLTRHFVVGHATGGDR